jgi:hypothetical protein
MTAAGRLPLAWFEDRLGTAFRARADAGEATLTLQSAQRLPAPWPDFGADCYQLVFKAGQPLPQGSYELAGPDGGCCVLFLAPGIGGTMHGTVW